MWVRERWRVFKCGSNSSIKNTRPSAMISAISATNQVALAVTVTYWSCGINLLEAFDSVDLTGFHMWSPTSISLPMWDSQTVVLNLQLNQKIRIRGGYDTKLMQFENKCTTHFLHDPQKFRGKCFARVVGLDRGTGTDLQSRATLRSFVSSRKSRQKWPRVLFFFWTIALESQSLMDGRRGWVPSGWESHSAHELCSV